MPAEVFYFRAPQCSIPGFGADLNNGPASKAKHMRRVDPSLLLHDRERFPIERDRDRSACFGLIRMHPTELSFLIDLRPLKTGDIRRPQTRRE